MNKRVAMSEISPLMAEALKNGGEVIFSITGCSMLPMLYNRRDKVCLAKPQGGCLKKYDLPLFTRQDGKYILHRIVSVKPEGYVAVGDNQYRKEYPVLPSQILGVVKGFWRKGKYISCDDLRYQVYCRLWVFLYPLRRLYFKGKQLLIRGVRLFICSNGDKHDEG